MAVRFFSPGAPLPEARHTRRACGQIASPRSTRLFCSQTEALGVFSTPLELLLDYLGVRNIILTGIAGDNCVLFTATDAYLRDLKLWVHADCIASASKNNNLLALQQMQRLLKADIGISSRLDFKQLKKFRA